MPFSTRLAFGYAITIGTTTIRPIRKVSGGCLVEIERNGVTSTRTVEWGEALRIEEGEIEVQLSKTSSSVKMNVNVPKDINIQRE